MHVSTNKMMYIGYNSVIFFYCMYFLTQEADIIFIALGDSVKLGKAQVDFSFCSP
jgi:hypothetical protein